MSTLYERVEKLLETHKFAREKDTYLLWDYLNQYDKKDGADMSVTLWLQKVQKGELPEYSALSRVRRKVQEDREDLRGDSYNERQREGARRRVVHASQ